MKIGEFLQKHIETAHISQAELARKSGVPASTISSIINRNNDRVAIEMMLKICEVLGCDLEEYINSLKKEAPEPVESRPIFLQSEMQHITKYRTLDEYGKKAVDDLLNTEYERCAAAAEAETIVFRRLHENKASAGTGYDLNNLDEWRSIEVIDTTEAREADFAVEIEGQSMEPDYYDGDIVYIALANDIEVGQVGLFMQNGKGYIKEKGDSYLISRNPEFEDIYPGDGEITCVGRVIGVAELPE